MHAYLSHSMEVKKEDSSSKIDLLEICKFKLIQAKATASRIPNWLWVT